MEGSGEGEESSSSDVNASHRELQLRWKEGAILMHVWRPRNNLWALQISIFYFLFCPSVRAPRFKPAPPPTLALIESL